MTEFVYYKKNVKYVIGGRYSITDSQGWTLTNENPFVSVDREKLRDFKLANKRTILEGTIIEVTEPSIEWEVTNAITDDAAVELVKNYLQLKQTLEKVDSLQSVRKLLDTANELDRPTKTIKLIESRVAELTEDADDFTKPEDMKGVE